ncbi:LysR family transcriptional regulator [Photobacterium sp. GJ3]|nr:LysR family transcriptional regulator [Photobacterium sp. GJ3]
MMTLNKTLDPVLLRSFIAVVDTGSFTRAADSTHLTQSTVSQQVRKLESQLGCELLQRKGRYVTATLEGERVLSYARRILQLMTEAVSQTSLSAEQQIIRLGVPEDFATHAIMPTLHAFSNEFPGIRLEVKSGMCSDIWREFQNSDLDLALVKQRPGSLPGLSHWPEPLCWIDSLHSNSLDKHPVPLVSFPIGGLYRNEMAHTFDSLGRSWRLAYVSTSLSGVCCAVESGLGISLLPRRLVTANHRILDEGDGLPPVPDMEVTLHAQDKVSALSRTLAERLIQTCQRIFDRELS